MGKEINAVAIIPAYKEEGTIANIVWAALLAENVDALVVVDDGSPDQTAATALAAYDEYVLERKKPFVVVRHDCNLGKTEAMGSGAFYARELGGTALRALMFIDADLSPLWSRETPQNRKLGSVIMSHLVRRQNRSLVFQDQTIREKAFQSALSEHIDAALGQVLRGESVMTIATCQRNKLIDGLRARLNWGALSGNRAISAELWDSMNREISSRHIKVSGWEVEAALNSFTRLRKTQEGVKLNRLIRKIAMEDVANVGSRVKTGSFVKGLLRMGSIHARAMWGFIKFGIKF